jgi:thiamine kinase-like enzyme
MSTDMHAPKAKGSNLRRAIGAFPTWLAGDAAPGEVISPIAHPMNQGVDGHCLKMTGINGESLFLKVLSKDQERWLRFGGAVEMAQNAGKAGLSPRLIASDEATRAYLFQCLDDNWRPAIVLDLRAEKVRAELLTATKNLHELALLGQEISVFARISELRQIMNTRTRRVDTGATRKVTAPENYSHMCAVIDRIGQGFAAASSELAPCHVENSLSNFLLGPSGSVNIVDFDRAADGDPLSDIGAFCNEYCRTDADVAQAVEIYAGRTDPATLARVKLHMILSAFQWGMWGKVSHFSSGRPEIEYYKYGENQFIRCAYHMANWDVDQLIREM